jgi:hypothetical protein
MAKLMLKPSQLITLMLLPGLAGCGLTGAERKAAGGFSTSAEAFGKVSASDFAAMRDDETKLRMTAYTTGTAVQWDTGNKGGIEGLERTLSGPFTPDEVDLRIKAANTLAAYGTALNALVTFDDSQKLKASADSFASSLKALPPKLKVGPDSDADVISSVVQGIGGLFIERQKADALRRIVPLYQPQVDRLCDLLTREFDTDNPGYAADYRSIASTVRVEAASRLATAGKDVAVRRRALPAFADADRAYRWAEETFPAAKSAGLACTKASAALTQAVAARNFSFADIEDFAEKVQAIAAASDKWKSRSK